MLLFQVMTARMQIHTKAKEFDLISVKLVSTRQAVKARIPKQGALRSL